MFDLEEGRSSSFSVAEKGTLSEDTIHIFLQQIGKVHDFCIQWIDKVQGPVVQSLIKLILD